MADEDKPRIIGGGGAKVIRGGSAEMPPVDKPAMGPASRRPGVVSGEDFEAKQSANRIVADGNERAAEIIASANKERDAIFKKAAADARAEVAAESTEIL